MGKGIGCQHTRSGLSQGAGDNCGCSLGGTEEHCRNEACQGEFCTFPKVLSVLTAE